MTMRGIKTLFPAGATPEGQGVTVYRSIGSRGLSKLDPFLLLDEMEIGAAATGVGFPDHPHRGFETVTYMLSGSMKHRDTVGNVGEISAGEAQWMTAGRGIVHSEMPTSYGTDIRGFQLWVNLPAKDKMKAPRYQDIAFEDIPVIDGDGYQARLVAGQLNGATGPVTEIAVQPFFADITLTETGSVSLPVEQGHTAFIYSADHDLEIAGKVIDQRTLIVLDDGNTVTIEGEKDSRFILVAGKPIGEPIARYGPFVMNTREEIMQAVDDWNKGTFLSA